jgi:SpoVK/Ycf46/Vps4 family AAA+-type ATPase
MANNELRRVVNSLLIFIDRIQPKGYLLAATNLDHSLDAAIWRRFDEVIWFDKPDRRMTARFLKMKFKNVAIAFDPDAHLDELDGRSYAELDRICVQAIKSAIIDRRKDVGGAGLRRRGRRRTAPGGKSRVVGTRCSHASSAAGLEIGLMAARMAASEPTREGGSTALAMAVDMKSDMMRAWAVMLASHCGFRR